MQIHSRKKRFAPERADAMTAAKQLMERIVERTLDPYEGYLQVCGIFQRHAHLKCPNCALSCELMALTPTGRYPSRPNCATRLSNVQRRSCEPPSNRWRKSPISLIIS